MGTALEHVALLQEWCDAGVSENPRGSNRVFICEEFGPVGGAPYYAWCMATQVVDANRHGTPVHQTASVGFGIEAAKAGEHGSLWLGRGDDCQVGDWSCFDFGGRGRWQDFHVSCVKHPGTQRKFNTLGGNEQDAVREDWRDRTYLLGFIRPAYSPPTEENVMTEDEVKLMQKMHDVTRADSRNAVKEATTTLVAFIQAAHDVTRAYLADVIKATGIMDEADIDRIVDALPAANTDAVIDEFVDRLTRAAS